jgi:hypothetical protein
MPMGVLLGLGFGFLLFGSVAAGAGVFAVMGARREAAGARSAWGQVLALEPRTGRRGSILCPQVRFSDEQGSLRTFTSSTGGRPPLHSVGQQVVVFYPPSHPERAELKPPGVLWLIPAGFIAIGLCLVAAGGFMLLIAMIAATGA